MTDRPAAPKIPYQLVKGLTGISVKFKCPKCSSVLRSALTEAGNRDACPDCSQPFVVPGGKEKLARAKAAAQAAKELEDQKAKKAAKKQEEREAKAAAKAKPDPVPDPMDSLEQAFTSPPQPYTPPQPASSLQSHAPSSPVPHSPRVIPTTRYRGLEVVSVFFKILALFVVVGWVLMTAMMVLGTMGAAATSAEMEASDATGIVALAAGGLISWAIISLGCFICAAFLWAASELIQLAMDMQANTERTSYKD